MAKGIPLLTLILFVIGMGLSILGTGLVGWSRWQFQGSDDEIHIGLYMVCHVGPNVGYECEIFYGEETWLAPVRGLDLVAVVMAVVSTSLCFLHAHQISMATISNRLKSHILVFGILSVILQVVALVIYGNNINEHSKLFYCFYLKGIAAGVLLIAYILLIAATRKIQMAITGREVETQPGDFVAGSTIQQSNEQPAKPMTAYPTDVMEQSLAYNHAGKYDTAVMKDPDHFGTKTM